MCGPGARFAGTRHRGYRGGGGSFWENFVFQLGAETFPVKFFCALWGHSWSFWILSGRGSPVLLRCCRQSVCSSRPFILLACEKLVVAENVCERGPSAKKAAFFEGWPRTNIGGVPKSSPHEIVPRRPPPPSLCSQRSDVLLVSITHPYASVVGIQWASALQAVSWRRTFTSCGEYVGSGAGALAAAAGGRPHPSAGGPGCMAGVPVRREKSIRGWWSPPLQE